MPESAVPEGAGEQPVDPRDREAAARAAATAVRAGAAEQAAALVGAEAAERVDLGLADLLARKLAQRSAAAPRPVAELQMPPLRHAADEHAGDQDPEQGGEPDPDEHGDQVDQDPQGPGDADDFEGFEGFEQPDEDPFEQPDEDPFEFEDQAGSTVGSTDEGPGEDAGEDPGADTDIDTDTDHEQEREGGVEDRGERLYPDDDAPQVGAEGWLLDDDAAPDAASDAASEAAAATQRSARRASRPLSAASLRAAAEGKPAQVPVERALVAELRQVLARTGDYSAAEAERVSQTDLVNGFLQAYSGVRLDGQKDATIEVAEAFASLDATRTMVQQMLEEARAERQDTMRLLKAVAARSRDIERDARTSALSSAFLVAESTAELNMQEVTPYNVDVLTPLSSAARDRIESLVDQELARRDLSRGRSL